MANRIPPHLQQSIKRIESAEISAPPPPWRDRHVFHVGGLTAVGFGARSDLLLVLSHDGRGVFDCSTNERVARDGTNHFRFDTVALESEGIGPLAGQTIRTTGIHGGGLPRGTHDGWTAESLRLHWPEATLLLIPPGNWYLGDAFNKPASVTKLMIETDVENDVRAFGFSPTGKSLIIATSSDITLYA